VLVLEWDGELENLSGSSLEILSGIMLAPLSAKQSGIWLGCQKEKKLEPQMGDQLLGTSMDSWKEL